LNSERSDIEEPDRDGSFTVRFGVDAVSFEVVDGQRLVWLFIYDAFCGFSQGVDDTLGRVIEHIVTEAEEFVSAADEVGAIREDNDTAVGAVYFLSGVNGVLELYYVFCEAAIGGVEGVVGGDTRVFGH